MSDEGGEPSGNVDEFILNIPKFAEGNVQTTKEVLGVTLDYSPESILEIDNIIQKCWPDGPPVMLNNMVITWGSYLGESIRRNHGGQWVADAQEGVFYLKLGNNTLLTSPFVAIGKRFQNGKTNSIAKYYNQLIAQL